MTDAHVTRYSLKGRDMSRHNLLSTQTPNVCITCHAALNAIAYIVYVKQLPAVSMGDWFSESRKGRWVGIYIQRVKTAWLCVGLAVKIPQ